MNRKIILLLTGMFCTSLVFSQTPHTLLWRISGKQIKRPSYLFGTMHVLCASDANLGDSLKAAIAACDEIYFEINLGDMMGMLNSLKYMRMNDDKTLADLAVGAVEPAEHQLVEVAAAGGVIVERAQGQLFVARVVFHQ